MIRLQLLTGMRPGEVVIMRGADLDTTQPVWVYTPGKHKTQSHGHARTIYLGPKAQEVVRPFLKPDPSAYLFSPTEAEEERRAAAHAARKTPLSCGNKPGSNRRRRTTGARYTTATYYGAIERGCAKAWPVPGDLSDAVKWLDDGRVAFEGITYRIVRAGDGEIDKFVVVSPVEQTIRVAWCVLDRDVPFLVGCCARMIRARSWRQIHRWHPHQLRHTAATLYRRDAGFETAKILLGHKTDSMVELYAERDDATARDAAARLG